MGLIDHNQNLFKNNFFLSWYKCIVYMGVWERVQVILLATQ